MGALQWNGPLHRDALVVGVVLEVVIVTMLVILLIRRRSGSQEATAVKLRGVLLYVLGAGGVAAAVLMVAGLHLHVFSQGTRPRAQKAPGARPSVSTRPRLGPGAAPHISLTVLLYALLVVVLLAGIAVCIWLARRLRPPDRAPGPGDDFIVEDPERLREAVESGRSALRTVDDARAAIIACYLAMETSLAERGTARGVADTPGELLTRATGKRPGPRHRRRAADRAVLRGQVLQPPARSPAAGRGRAGPGRAGRRPGRSREPESRGAGGAERAEGAADERARGPSGTPGPRSAPGAGRGRSSSSRSPGDHRGGGGRLPHGRLGRAVRGGHGRRGGRDGRAARPAAHAHPGQARKAREKPQARPLSGYSHRRFVRADLDRQPGFYQGELRPVLEHLLAARLAERHGVHLYQNPDAARRLLCRRPRDADLWPWIDPTSPAETPGVDAAEPTGHPETHPGAPRRPIGETLMGTRKRRRGRARPSSNTSGARRQNPLPIARRSFSVAPDAGQAGGRSLCRRFDSSGIVQSMANQDSARVSRSLPR